MWIGYWKEDNIKIVVENIFMVSFRAYYFKFFGAFWFFIILFNLDKEDYIFIIFSFETGGVSNHPLEHNPFKF